ncbi:MAG: hypothetical protein AB7R90_08365 [Reyranellaceae bacterium]
MLVIIEVRHASAMDRPVEPGDDGSEEAMIGHRARVSGLPRQGGGGFGITSARVHVAHFPLSVMPRLDRGTHGEGKQCSSLVKAGRVPAMGRPVEPGDDGFGSGGHAKPSDMTI